MIGDELHSGYGFLENKKLNKAINEAVTAGLIFIVDRKIEWVNQVILDMFGYTYDELIGESAIIFYGNKAQFQELGKHAYDKISKGETYSVEIEGQKKDGTKFWCILTSRALDSNDPSKGSLWTTTDISESKKNDEYLNKFKASIELATDAVYWIRIDGSFEYVNDQACTVLGYTKEELMELSVFDVDVEITLDSFKKAWERDGENDSQRIETYHRKKDGTEFPVEVITNLLCLGDERIHVSYARDISERKKRLFELKEALRDAEESEQRFKALHNASFGGIILHHEGIVQDVNDRMVEISGISKEEIVGSSILSYLAEESLEEGKEVIRTRVEEPYELIGQRKNGEKYPARVEGRNMPYKGKIVRVVEVRDISEQKKTEQELLFAKEKAEESDELKTAFLANLSHEIRTPMNGILGFASLLKNEDLSKEARAQYVEIIEHSGKRMLGLINDLVDISRIEANQVILEPENTDLNALFDEIYDFYLPQFKDRRLLFVYDNSQAEPDVFVLIDKHKLEQVLSNLLNNAMKFTKVGKVELNYKCVDGSLLFSVKDTGIGIPEDKLEIIFERFRQADDGYLKEIEGTGLGLSISKSFVEKMGGEIWVESKLGKGSEFHVRLPIKFQDKKEKKIKKEGKLMETVLKVLIAEDDQISYTLLEQMFKAYNCHLLRAENGKEAVELFHEHKDVDLILMDIKMPVMNGIEAIEQIRKLNANVPILAQTAFASEKDSQAALDAGCTDFVTKPINADLLYEKINIIFKQRE